MGSHMGFAGLHVIDSHLQLLRLKPAAQTLLNTVGGGGAEGGGCLAAWLHEKVCQCRSTGQLLLDNTPENNWCPA